MGRKLGRAILALGLAGFAANAGAAGFQGIYILSGSWGQNGNWHKVDITERLQDLCGNRGGSCDIWCSQSSFGGRNLGKHSLCRVIYRCPDGTTKSAEASREEPILMRCRSPEGDQG